MYCGQCGKRVLDTMLFCPFCGAAIVIPEQDEAPAQEPAPERDRDAGTDKFARGFVPDEEESTEQGFEPWPEEAGETEEEPLPELDAEEENSSGEDEGWDEEKFEPLIPENEPATEESKDQQPAVKDELPRPASLFDEELFKDPEPDSPEPEERGQEAEGKRQAPRPRPAVQLAKPGGARPKQSYIPVRDVDVDDIFMDSSHPRREKGFDPYDDSDFEDDDDDEAFDFEEPERGSFFQRHLRGMVGLLLTLMLLVIFLIWAALPQGQRALAGMNLAWSASAYNDLGHEAYEARQFEQAAAYFERALARDGRNYEYAHSAMVAHYEAGDDAAALDMLKRCIEMDPDSPEPYHELLILYPDANSRPWEVSELVRLGYERTGDESLNLSGE